ncbi:Phosphatidylinositol:ceramide phosphoinositol transferase (IPC synthase) [Malassezia vespertilionis]|uniref:Ipc1p n=1 Tax=Malassezia vespertilionis TaxID=2020962 RepID=A0A2N1J7Y8_9BASI|nr:Phosphatidylinositol:ceramide phosphoinositol transferase (IPC synthase) [Malassezia vespertilionis]PKI82677.1 Ipc1p [Malassezia vespertilionis]WFD08599.1 Phosphatidylinositol:ceramide phosphoinositol transferase (IPC synthase) [Malassezia vespertilionis]
MSRVERLKYGAMLVIATFAIVIVEDPPFPYKLLVPLLYSAALLIPITSQFILPASPILLWLVLYYSCRFIPESTRPHIWVSVLPTLETIWYGANISDILTRFGHPLLDVLAWIPYGVVHFIAPFVVASFIFVFAPQGSVKMFANAFGFTNLVGVLIQIAFPCAPPWYELREGLTAANYGMRGSPAGLARIDHIFHGHGYTLTFTGAPVVFGAFPSLHAATATCESLFLSYFFPYKLRIGRFSVDVRIFYWGYSFWLYWCTMYLMHHYLIDLVAGGCLATLSFYVFRTEQIREAMEQRVADMEYAEHRRNQVPLPPSDNLRIARLAGEEAGQAAYEGRGWKMSQEIQRAILGDERDALSTATPFFALEETESAPGDVDVHSRGAAAA